MNITKTSNNYYLQIGKHIEQKYSKLNCKNLYGVKIATFLDTVTYWSITNGRVKKFRHHGKTDWCFYTYKQFRSDLGCGTQRAANIVEMCVAAGVIETETFGSNNKMHFRVIPERLIALAEEAKIEEKIIAQMASGYQLDVALPEWLEEDAELVVILLNNRKKRGKDTDKYVQITLLKDLEYIKKTQGISKAREMLKYAALQGITWVNKLVKPVADEVNLAIGLVKKYLIKELGLAHTLVENACTKAYNGIKRRRQKQTKKCPNLALGHI